MSAEATDEELREREHVLLTRLDYEAYEAELQQQRSVIVDRNGDSSAVDVALQRLDGLYKQHVLDTRSSVVVAEDQQALLHVSDVVLARARNHVSGEPGQISVNSFLGALRQQAIQQQSGTKVFNRMSELFTRGAGTAVLPSSIPELAAAERRRGHSGRSERAPSENMAVQPTDVTEENGDTDDREQQLAMQTIFRVLLANEEANDFEPILMYELCLQPRSFAETMENLFLVSVLVSLGKLWLMPNKRGLPLVGTMQNRPAYLRLHGGSVNPEEHNERQQFNFNMNYKLWMKLCDVYTRDPHYEPLLKRRRDADTYDLYGRQRGGTSLSR